LNASFVSVPVPAIFRLKKLAPDIGARLIARDVIVSDSNAAGSISARHEIGQFIVPLA